MTVPVMALTATVTVNVFDDIKKNLYMYIYVFVCRGIENTSDLWLTFMDKLGGKSIPC